MIQFHSICATGSEAGENYILDVSDNGTGFTRDRDHGIKRSLGLQLVDTLVDQLGGSISLDMSNGTAFRIIFPKTGNC